MESITSDDMQKVDLLLSRGADPNISPPLVIRNESTCLAIMYLYA